MQESIEGELAIKKPQSADNELGEMWREGGREGKGAACQS